MTSPVTVQDAIRRRPKILGAIGWAAFPPLLSALPALAQVVRPDLVKTTESYLFAALLALALVVGTLNLVRSLRIAKRPPLRTAERDRYPPTRPQMVLTTLALPFFGAAAYQAAYDFDLYADFLRARSPIPDALIDPWAILIILCLVQFILFLKVELARERA